MSETSGIVFNVQHLTVHDGPGIRTEVFLKGCPLRCKWCSNPEGLDPKPELGIFPNKCITLDKCGFCVKACPKEGKPLEFNEDGIIVGSNMECIRCMSCTKACFTHAIKAWGKLMTVDDVMEEVLKDRAYYEQNGGGITLNGGEVTVQSEFCIAILEACRKENVNTCVETTMHCDYSIIQKLIPLTDLFLVDLKFMDSERHKEWTGAGNERILENLIRAADNRLPMVLRIPVIPGINNDEENIRASAKFIAEDMHNRVYQVQLLPYKKMGVEKYHSLGQLYPLGEDYAMLPRQEWESNLIEVRDIMREYGVRAEANSTVIIDFDVTFD